LALFALRVGVPYTPPLPFIGGNLSWKATAFVKSLEQSAKTGKKITRPEKFVLMMMADYHNDAWGYASPSIESLAHDCLYDERQVMRIVSLLEQNGFIEVLRAKNRRNRYVILGVTKCQYGGDKMSPYGDISVHEMSPEPLRTNIKPPLKPKPVVDDLEVPEPKTPILLTENLESIYNLEPEWLPKKAWKDFQEMRDKNKKKMTNRAKELIIHKLERLRDKGEDPERVLEQSIVNAWQDVYEVTKPRLLKSSEQAPTVKYREFKEEDFQ
jgi:DNA-binding MarR family transcriptional regulator